MDTLNSNMDTLNINMNTLNSNMDTLNINMNALKFNTNALCLNAIETEDTQTKKRILRKFSLYGGFFIIYSIC